MNQTQILQKENCVLETDLFKSSQKEVKITATDSETIQSSQVSTSRRRIRFNENLRPYPPFRLSEDLFQKIARAKYDHEKKQDAFQYQKIAHRGDSEIQLKLMLMYQAFGYKKANDFQQIEREEEIQRLKDKIQIQKAKSKSSSKHLEMQLFKLTFGAMLATDQLHEISITKDSENQQEHEQKLTQESKLSSGIVENVLLNKLKAIQQDYKESEEVAEQIQQQLKRTKKICNARNIIFNKTQDYNKLITSSRYGKSKVFRLTQSPVWSTQVSQEDDKKKFKDSDTISVLSLDNEVIQCRKNCHRFGHREIKIQNQTEQKSPKGNWSNSIFIKKNNYTSPQSPHSKQKLGVRMTNINTMSQSKNNSFTNSPKNLQFHQSITQSFSDPYEFPNLVNKNQNTMRKYNLRQSQEIYLEDLSQQNSNNKNQKQSSYQKSERTQDITATRGEQQLSDVFQTKLDNHYSDINSGFGSVRQHSSFVKTPNEHRQIMTSNHYENRGKRQYQQIARTNVSQGQLQSIRNIKTQNNSVSNFSEYLKHLLTGQ